MAGESRIKQDDRMIQNEGLDTLSESELRSACRERGMLGMRSVEEMRQQVLFSSSGAYSLDPVLRSSAWVFCAEALPIGAESVIYHCAFSVLCFGEFF